MPRLAALVVLGLSLLTGCAAVADRSLTIAVAADHGRRCAPDSPAALAVVSLEPSCRRRVGLRSRSLCASLELAVTDPALYAESLRQAGEGDGTTLRRDLAALLEESRVLFLRWKHDRSGSEAEAAALRTDLVALRRRHTAALERAAVRSQADGAVRAAEALIAAASAWERERAAGTHIAEARDDAERRAATREREEAGRLAREHCAPAERWIVSTTARQAPTPGTASPAAGGTP